MNHYCTYFDSHYLPNFRCLAASLTRHDAHAHISAFCLDAASYQELTSLGLPSVQTFTLADLEAFEPRLLEAKGNRTEIEYYFTLSPQICLFTLNHFKEAQQVTYVDADLYFFQNPAGLLNLGQASVSIIPHRNWGLGKVLYNKYGIYNVGWMTFRRSVEGLQCLTDWGEDCLHWCYDRFEEGKFADQKYLNYWPAKYACSIIENPGANLAPWNIGQYHIKVSNGCVEVNAQPLIFYHFASLKQTGPLAYKSNLSKYFTATTDTISQHIYQPYLEILRTFSQQKEFSVRGKNQKTSLLGWLQGAFREAKNILFKDTIYLES